MKKSRNFFESLGFAANGILYSFRTQRNIRIHTFCALGILFFARYLHISNTELLVLILTIIMVITLEIINTAVETVVDMYTDEYLPLAKVAKNVAAGAVLLASVSAVIIGILIFGPRVWAIFLR